MQKQCFKCGETKPINEFYAHDQMADGHLGKCRDCTKTDVTSRYYSPEGRKKVRAYEKARFKTPHRKAKIALYQRKRRALHRDKYKAHTAVNNAIRDGRLLRLPCEVCNDPKAQAHHDDYRKPLDVRWLCFRHHRELEHGQRVG